MENTNFWFGFEKQAKRMMLSDITSRMEPTMIVVFNPQDQRAKLFIQRLDKVLQDMGGNMDRLRIMALNQMMDRELIKQLGASEKEPSVLLYRQGKPVGVLGGEATPTDIIEFMNANRKHLV